MSSTILARICTPVTAFALVAGLSACGGGGGTTQPPIIEPPTTVTTTLPTFTFNSVPPGVAVFTDVSVNGSGSLSATADWTFSSSDIDIYVTSTSCAASNTNNLQSGCVALGRTTSGTAKPERLTVNVAQGNYRLWIANFGPGTESGTLQASATVTR